MAESTLGTLLEMIQILLSNTIKTLGQIFGKLTELGVNLFTVSEAGGLAGLILAVVIGGVVAILFLKFVLGIGKTVLVLVGAGIVILLIIFMLI